MWTAVLVSAAMFIATHRFLAIATIGLGALGTLSIQLAFGPYQRTSRQLARNCFH